MCSGNGGDLCSALLFSHLSIASSWSPSSRFSLVSRARSHFGGSFSDDDAFSFFPWSDGNNAIPEERITLFTSDGLIQIGGNMVPRRIKPSHIVAAETKSKGGLQEKLTMTVAVPYLWGVPPASERLHLAVRTGGGIVDKVFWQWHFL